MVGAEVRKARICMSTDRDVSPGSNEMKAADKRERKTTG